VERLTSHSAEETIALGKAVGESLKENSILCFFGELAAGKTTFIKGVVAGAAALSPEQVISPTFVYLNIYKGKKTVYHFDLYRLKDIDQFLSMGFDEYLFSNGICCIEWSERIAALLPENTIKVFLTHAGDQRREILIGNDEI
jgi:tRNA threonylcarbamoyladenosine biosynthesis protein TsaE